MNTLNISNFYATFITSFSNFRTMTSALIFKNIPGIQSESWEDTITPKMVKFPCGICQKGITKRYKVNCCDLYNKWIHIACNNLDKKNIQKSPVLRNQLVLHTLPKKKSFPSILSPVNTLKRSLDMHQLFLCP